MQGTRTKFLTLKALSEFPFDWEKELVTKSGYDVCAGFGIRCDNLFGKWRRQNTAYADDESNWSCLCEECQIETDEYWQDMWDEYNSSRF